MTTTTVDEIPLDSNLEANKFKYLHSKNVGDFYISFCQDLNNNADEYNIIITEGFVFKYIESIGGENNPVFTARCYASAVLAMGLCPPVSVGLSVTSRSSTKTEKRRITQTTPHDTSGTLVF